MNPQEANSNGNDSRERRKENIKNQTSNEDIIQGKVLIHKGIFRKKRKHKLKNILFYRR